MTIWRDFRKVREYTDILHISVQPAVSIVPVIIILILL